MEKHNNLSDDVLLRVEHLCQYFKMRGGELKAVDDVSFDIKRGEVFGLVGESGCGKTTTGRSIIKLYNCTSGDVYFDGERICAGTRSYRDAIGAARKEYRETLAAIKASEMSPEEKTRQKAEAKTKREAVCREQSKRIASARRDHRDCDKKYAARLLAELEAEYLPRLGALADGSEEKKSLMREYKAKCRIAKKTKLITKIQMIFQDPIASLDPRMTVRDIIAEGLVIRGEKDKKAIDEKVFRMLETVGLVREHANRYPHEFSGGQRQRIGVARSVIMEPKLIIADEPVSALDVSIQAQVINLLNELREKLGLTILFVAHDLSVVKYFSDRIGVMYYGRLIELASSDELFLHPLHPYTRSLLSAIPLPDPHYEKQRKRIVYNPLTDHDYSKEKPAFREVAPGHFVSCSDSEYAAYRAELGL